MYNRLIKAVELPPSSLVALSGREGQLGNADTQLYAIEEKKGWFSLSLRDQVFRLMIAMNYYKTHTGTFQSLNQMLD